MDFDSLISSFRTETESDGTFTVTRTAEGVTTNGIYVPGSTSTFTIVASIQPATGLQRVTGGRDLRSDWTNQHVDDVRVCYSKDELKTRTPTCDPDEITFEGAQWTAMRVEKWVLGTDLYYKTTLTRKLFGAS